MFGAYYHIQMATSAIEQSAAHIQGISNHRESLPADNRIVS